ncbi:MAG: HEAT repeat domain-containing protein [Alphaproteobacteria bacterium]|jgi:HEAT repeat protein|nr:HEAT repeat domain-containing protein [Alphaproteobacteria bacterium]MDP7427483.1 HEAT repeat domain-containing protein [Alphaproteobacteria bacterium]
MVTRFVIRPVIAGLAVWLAVTPVLANGWEHWGVPLDILLATLGAEEPGYRMRAARSLGVRQEPRAVAPMLARLADADERPLVKDAVMAALGQIGDHRAVPILTRVLKHDVRDELRAAAAAALAGMAAAQALPDLIAAYEGDRSLIVRAGVVEALGAFDDPSAISLLTGLLAADANPSLRRKAIRSLGLTRSPSVTVPLLAALSRASGASERGAIVEALGHIADPRALAGLAALYDRTRDNALKVRLAVALGAIRDGSAVPKLIELLQSDLAAVQFFAIEALAEAGDERAAQPLRQLYRRATVSSRTSLELAKQGRPAAYLAEQSLRLEAIRVLASLDAAGSLAEFLDAAAVAMFDRSSGLGLRLNEGSYQLRRMAIAGLGYSGALRATRFLLAGPIDDGDFRLRAAAARALGVLGHDQASDALAALLGDVSAEVRWVAARVLGRLKRPAAGAGLVAALDDRHPEVRRQAVLSLGYLADPAACERIAGLEQGDPDEAVRNAARATAGILCRGG